LTSGIRGDFLQRTLPYRKTSVRKPWNQRKTLRPDPKRDPSRRKAMLGKPKNARVARNRVRIAMRTDDRLLSLELRPVKTTRKTNRQRTEVAFVVGFRSDAEDILCADRLTMPLRPSKSRL
jgi:hypothetical protein